MAHDSHAHTHDITSEMVDDILCAAFEGGSNYWIDKLDVDDFHGAEYASEVLTRGGTLVVHVFEDDAMTLTLEAMQAGIRKAARFRGLTPERFYEEHDAGDADLALQFALLNEIRFG